MGKSATVGDHPQFQLNPLWPNHARRRPLASINAVGRCLQIGLPTTCRAISMKNARTKDAAIEICILAGGQSSRMGRDKSGLRLGGKTLLGRIRQTAEQSGFPVRVMRRDLVAS